MTFNDGLIIIPQMKVSSEALTILLIYIFLTVMVTGCSTFQRNTHDIPHEPIPDYNKPEAQFAAVDFFTISAGLINDHPGEYIVFEGYYSGIMHDPILYYKGRKRRAKDMQAFHVRKKKHSVRNVRIIYHDAQEKEVGKLATLNRMRTRLKVFAYVLPPGKPAVLKNGKPFRSFDETLIWLIRVEVLFDGGIYIKRK